jgi:orotate phosphoribosyltransferase-like protein
MAKQYEEYEHLIEEAKQLKAEGKTSTEAAEEMGISESSYQDLLYQND